MFEEVKERMLDRRSLLRSAGGFALGAGALGLLAGCGGHSAATSAFTGSAGLQGVGRADVSDSAVLNFALNLEYLEAEFYQRAVRGRTLDDEGLAGQEPSSVIAPTTQVTFSNRLIEDLAQELAFNERNHVALLQGILGENAVGRPTLNYTDSFAALGAKLGRESFDPFSNEVDFLLTAFLFEEVGVSAYLGGASLLSSPGNILTASRIYAVEAYQGGAIRTLIADQGGAAVELANAISDERDRLDGVGTDKDKPVEVGGRINYAPTDDDGLLIPRTTGEVIKIATNGADDNTGGFFPNGLRGTIK